MAIKEQILWWQLYTIVAQIAQIWVAIASRSVSSNPQGEQQSPWNTSAVGHVCRYVDTKYVDM